MALAGQVNPEQLTTFVLYVEFVTAANLSVCDQWGPLMEAIGASERVMYYLDKPPAPQVAAGRMSPSWSCKVDLTNIAFAYPTRSDSWRWLMSHSSLNLASWLPLWVCPAAANPP
ncbi:TPA: hypothetical protein ACH3X1_004912 [Trebouxia sp. C0004]